MKNLQDLIERAKVDFLYYLNTYFVGNTEIKITWKEEMKLADDGSQIIVKDNYISFFIMFEAIVDVKFSDHEDVQENYDCHELLIPVGFKTPKGYFSTKKLPVSFEYRKKDYLTLEQALELSNYETDAKKNTFDPFYHENQAKMRNAAALVHIARNYITDPYCTR